MLLLQGILSLAPQVEATHGSDARIRFYTGNSMVLYNDPNGSFKGRRDIPELEFEIDYFHASVATSRPGEHLATKTTSSQESLMRAWGWIQNCLTNHVLCGKDEARQLPTRILDLGDVDDEDDGEEDDEPLLANLMETSEGDLGKYVALSHSWGNEQPLKATTDNLADHKEPGILVSSLPRTFRDAIQITRRLGLRYLWIDSLCIIQDSVDDWQIESSKMAQVYRNSWVTVAATNSTSTTSGCFNTQRAVTVQAENANDETLNVLFPAASDLRRNLRLTLRFCRKHPDFGLYASPRANVDFPLLSRGWAYQERLLAPRVLHFGRHELLWECMQDLDCECGQMKWSNAQNMGSYMNRNTTGELPPKIAHYAALHVGASTNNSSANNDNSSAISKTPQDNRGEQQNGEDWAKFKRNQKLLARWEEMIVEYSGRSLTYGTDRLPAFSGVASEMVETLGFKYMAGLWQEMLPIGLLWVRSNNTELATARRDPWPAPSWSWASIDAPVEFLVKGHARYKKRKKQNMFCSLQEVHCVPAGKDPRGQVVLKQSYIILSAQLKTVELWFTRGQFMDGRPSRASVAISKGKKGPSVAFNGSFMVRGSKAEPSTFTPDIQICDAEGNWNWGENDEIYCARMLKTEDLYAWLILRPVPGEPDVFERIGAICDTEANWKCEGGARLIKII